MTDTVSHAPQSNRPNDEALERAGMLIASVSSTLLTLQQLVQEVLDERIGDAGPKAHATHDLLALCAWKADLALKALGEPSVGSVDPLQRLLAPGERQGLVNV